MWHSTHIYDILIWERRIKTGDADERVYKMGLIDNDIPFEELRKAAFINDRAVAADKAKDFSQKIRTHLKR
jgi:hypothetical protein